MALLPLFVFPYLIIIGLFGVVEGRVAWFIYMGFFESFLRWRA